MLADDILNPNQYSPGVSATFIGMVNSRIPCTDAVLLVEYVPDQVCEPLDILLIVEALRV